MKILVQIVLKSMRKNKTRTMITISGIVLSAILIFSLGFGFSTLRRYRFDKIAQEIGSYHVLYHQLPRQDYDKILHNSKVEKVYFFKKYDETKIQDITYSIYITNGLELSSVNLKEGTYPTKENQILLPESARTIYGNINDIIQINQHSYQISGFYYENLISKSQNILYIYQERPILEGNYNYQVTFKNIENLKEQVLKLGDLLELPFSLETKWHEQEEINHDLFVAYGETEEMSGAIDTLVLVMSLCIVSFACILVVYNAFAISVNEQRKMYGTLASIGITPMKRMLLVLIEATIYTIISIPIGLLFSIILISGFIMLLNGLSKDISIIQYHFYCYPLFFMISNLFLIGIIYLAAFVPALEAKKINPIEMIKEQGIIKRKRVRNSIFGIEASLAKKNHFRNKRKYQIVILSIVLGIVLFLLATSFSRMYYKKSSFKVDEQNPDIRITIETIKEIDAITANLNHVISKEEWVRTFIPVVLVNENNSIMAIGLDENTWKDYQQKLNIKKDIPILLNHYQVYDTMNQKEEGKLFETIPKTISLFYVEFPSKKRQKLVDINEFEVTTILPDGFYLGNKKMATLFLKDQDLKQLLKQNDIEERGEYEFQIKTNSFIKVDQLVKKIFNQYPGKVKEYQNQALEQYQNKMNILIQQIILYGVILLSVIISVTSIMNTLKASIQLRKKEFAVMRSIGMDEKSFHRMLLHECLLIGSDAILIGFVVVAVILFIINLILFQLPNFEQLVVPNFIDIIIVIIMVFSSIIMTMLLEVKKIKGTNIIDSIKEETF